METDDATVIFTTLSKYGLLDCGKTELSQRKQRSQPSLHVTLSLTKDYLDNVKTTGQRRFSKVEAIEA